MLTSWCTCVRLTAAILLLLVHQQVPMVQGRSSGAPDSSCFSLLPQHKTEPQKYFQSPYSLTVSRVSPRLFNVSVVASQSPFKGFILQARDFYDSDGLIVDGSFTPNLFTRVINCQSKLPNTLTHNSAMDKYYTSVLWRPSQSFRHGKLLFRGTVVMNYRTFWVVESNPIEIASSDLDDRNHVSPASLHQADSRNMRTVKPEYSECTRNHLCFGLPSGCVANQNCHLLLKSRSLGGTFTFEINAPSDSASASSSNFDGRYFSIALSDDASMGDDLVFDCIKIRNDLQPRLKLSYNERDVPTNTHLSDQILRRITQNIRTGFIENRMFCRWEMQHLFEVRDRTYNLWENFFHVLMARGQLKEDSDAKEQHDEALASERVQLKDVGVKSGRRMVKPLIKLHGSFMVLVWLCLAPIGITIARNFKQSWDSTLCGTKFWFALHRGLMLFNLGLASVSLIAIFVHVNGWRAHNLHPWTGLASTLFMFQQPLNALFRCAPDDENRWIFNKIHWFFGNLGHIFAVATIFLASDLDAASLPSAFNWMLFGLVLFHVANQIFFSCLSWHFYRQAKDEMDMDMPRSDIVKESKGNSIKNFMFCMYVMVLSVFALAFILMISVDRNP